MKKINILRLAIVDKISDFLVTCRITIVEIGNKNMVSLKQEVGTRFQLA